MLQTVAAVAGGLVITEVTLRAARSLGRKVGPKMETFKEKVSAKRVELREKAAEKAAIKDADRKGKKLVREVERLQKAHERVAKAQSEYLALIELEDEADAGLPQHHGEEG